MGDSAKLVYKNRELELPVITGTEHESAVDISKLRGRHRSDHAWTMAT